jgi:hypothetical protein
MGAEQGDECADRMIRMSDCENRFGLWIHFFVSRCP